MSPLLVDAVSFRLEGGNDSRHAIEMTAGTIPSTVVKIDLATRPVMISRSAFQCNLNETLCEPFVFAVLEIRSPNVDININNDDDDHQTNHIDFYDHHHGTEHYDVAK